MGINLLLCPSFKKEDVETKNLDIFPKMLVFDINPIKFYVVRNNDRGIKKINSIGTHFKYKL